MTRGWRTVAAFSLTLFVAACGEQGGSAEGRLLAASTTAVPATTTTTSTTTTVAPTTTIAPTTTEATTTTIETTTTTAAPTTTTPPPTAAPTTAPPPPPKAPVVSSKRQTGTIWMPRIGVAVPMVEGIDNASLNLGAGHWPGTAMPGQLGNSVIAGHRVSHTKPFRNIHLLEPGDEVVFETADGSFTYHVVSTEIVPPTATWIINPTPDATATLFACHPPGSTRERIVVHLKLA